jgi:MSHA biogenesis protein MshI
LLSFFKKKSQSAVLGIEVSDKGIAAALARPDANGILQIHASFSKRCPKSEQVGALKEWVSDQHLEGATCHVVLPEPQYKTFPVEKPPVEEAELAEAVRWKIKDLIDYPLDEAVIDVYPFPTDALRGRPEQVSVVCCRASVVKSIVNLVEQAGLKLDTIDVIDLALRNLAARVVETASQTAAMLYLRSGGGLIVLTKGDTLYFARHFDFSLEALNDVERQDSVIQHLALEVQRSFDYFDSQMAQVPPKLLYLIGPTPNLPLANMLGGNISAQVQVFDSSLCFGEQRKMTQDEIFAFAAMGVALKEGGH